MNLSPLPVQKFFDNNGSPLVGGLLFTYVAGTTTKIATYTDASGSTPNTNPIVLNFRGECQLWVSPSLAYKFVLSPAGDTDPPGNPIWTVDNISIATGSLDNSAQDTGSGNSIQLAIPSLPSIPSAFTRIVWKSNLTNTGAVTLTLNGGVTKSLQWQNQQALSANAILLNGMYEAIYDGTAWQLQGPCLDVTQLRSTAEVTAGVLPTDYPRASSACIGYSVLRTGADPTGATSSDAAIANAILAAKRMGVQNSGTTGRDQGVDVYFPAGLYTIDNPIVLPRGGNARTFCIGLIGDGEATRIQPSASFPAGRAIIEWEAVTARVFGQRIRNLKLEMRTNLAHKAIWFKLNDPGTPIFGGEIWSQEEIKELYIERVQIHGDNTSHAVLVDIEGKAKLSRFEITADMAPGAGAVFSSIILRCPSAYLTSAGAPGAKVDAFGDNAGLNYCYLSLTGSPSRGGRTTLFQGRIADSFIENLTAGVGALGAESVLDMKGSCCNVFAWLFAEGRQEDPQIYMEECYFNHFLSCNVSTPDAPGPGTAFGLVKCEDNVFWNHPSAVGKPSYSSQGGFLIDMDANCKRNKFYNFHSNGASFASEVRDLGSNNYIQFFREDTGLATETHQLATYGVGPFTQENIVINQTDIALSMGGIVGGRWIAPRAGSVTGVAMKLTGGRTAGNLTMKVFKSTTSLSGSAGSELSSALRADIFSTNTDQFVATFTPSLYTFAAGDELWLNITTSAGWAPTTSDIRAWLEVQC